MFECLTLLLAVPRAALRDRSELLTEMLLLCHQLAVLTRPTRQRRRVRWLDALLLVLMRRLRRAGRRHPVLVAPDAVIRWRRAGWRLCWRWRSRAGGGDRGSALSPRTCANRRRCQSTR